MTFDKSNAGFPTNQRDACADVGITKEQWFKLPIELRKRWWHETDYGHNKPSSELTAAIMAAAQEGTTMEDPKDKPAEDPKPAEQKPEPAESDNEKDDDGEDAA